jgi:SOS-response transcriptional repressor LexA
MIVIHRATRARAGTGKRVLGYRASQVLRFVQDHLAAHGQAPSYGTIRDGLGFADKCEVARVVYRLEKRGLLIRVGAGRVRRGKQWNAPVLRLVLEAAIPVVGEASKTSLSD